MKLSDLFIQLGISCLFVFFGQSMYKGNIKWLHSYQRKRIQEQNVPKVGKMCGIGCLIIAITMALSAILIYFTKNAVFERIIGAQSPSSVKTGRGQAPFY